MGKGAVGSSSGSNLVGPRFAVWRGRAATFGQASNSRVTQVRLAVVGAGAAGET